MTTEEKLELAIAQLNQLHTDLLQILSLTHLSQPQTAIGLLRLKRRECERTLERLRG
jgi:hypothetical protein